MRIKLLIVLIILFCSCNRQGTFESRKSGIPLVIDLLSEPESEVARLSDISTNVQYFPLQTTPSSLVGNVDKIVTCGNNIYIKNSYSEILCFDQKGNFLFKLNKTGRGPENINILLILILAQMTRHLLPFQMAKYLFSISMIMNLYLKNLSI